MGRITVLASAGAREVAADNVEVSLENGEIEKHGYFTLKLLKILGWKHSDKVISFINADEREVSVNGYLAGTRSSLSMDDLYLEIMKNWDNRQQNPVLYSTLDSVNIIPAN